MQLNKHLASALAIALALSWAVQARASVTVYTGEAGFAAAAGATTTHDFNGVLIDPTLGLAYGPQTVGGVTFDSTGAPFVLAVGAGGSTYGKQFFSGQSATAAPSDVLVSLAGSNAIAFHYGAYLTTPGTPITFTLSSGEVFSQLLPPLSGTDTNFIGFISTTAITGLTLATVANVASPPPYAYTLDVVDFTVGALATPVPEPSGWALMLAGLAVGGGIGLRRRAR